MVTLATACVLQIRHSGEDPHRADGGKAKQRTDGHLKAATKADQQTMLGLNAKARASLFLLRDDLHALDIINPP